MCEMSVRPWPAVKMSGKGSEDITERVAVERPVVVKLNGVEVATLLCTPSDLDALAVGYLVSEQYFSRASEVDSVDVTADGAAVAVTTISGARPRAVNQSAPVITSGCGGGRISRQTLDLGAMWCLGAGLSVSADRIRRCMKEFAGRSETFRETGGVHSAALNVDEDIVVFAEDIGRHNAVDKVFGRGLLGGVAVRRAVLLTSGRISAEVTLKAAAHRVRVVVSRAAPTTLALDIAQQTRVTLVGFARGDRMTVFTHRERIVSNDDEER
jgi:FdhD protein